MNKAFALAFVSAQAFAQQDVSSFTGRKLQAMPTNMTNNGTYDYSYYNPYYNTSSSYYPYGGYNYSNVTYSLNSTNTANATYAPYQNNGTYSPYYYNYTSPSSYNNSSWGNYSYSPSGNNSWSGSWGHSWSNNSYSPSWNNSSSWGSWNNSWSNNGSWGHNNSWYNNSMNNWTWNQWDNSEDCINPLFMEGIFESEGCSCDVQKWSQSLMWKSPRNCKIFAQGCNKYEVTRDQKIRSCTERSYCEYYDNRPKCIQYHENKWSWESGASQLVASAAVAVAALSTIY